MATETPLCLKCSRPLSLTAGTPLTCFFCELTFSQEQLATFKPGDWAEPVAKASPAALGVTPDCCEIWPRMVHGFGWFGIEDQPEIRLMPYIPSGGHKWRVNHCPSCGADRTGVVITAKALEAAHVAAE